VKLLFPETYPTPTRILAAASAQARFRKVLASGHFLATYIEVDKIEILQLHADIMKVRSKLNLIS